MTIQKNAGCPNCKGIMKKRGAGKDIILYCTACGSVFKVVGITDFDGEFDAVPVEYEGN